MNYDKVIIGGGMYGLYSAIFCAKQGDSVLIIEKEDSIFERASYINQARIHNGYHYPRSFSTAHKTALYYKKYGEYYNFTENKNWTSIYATSKNFSWTNAKCFKKFCDNLNIKCEEINSRKYFKENVVDGAFVAEEHTYDAKILKEYFLDEIKKYSNIDIFYNSYIDKVEKRKNDYILSLNNKEKIITSFVLNTTYASINQIHDLFGFEPIKIKYELCEIILCKINDDLKKVGITVMDGPFFSIMPFGKTGLHSLTSVTFTPHITSYDNLPTFPCQEKSDGYCTCKKLGNCNKCKVKPKSAWIYMSNLAKKYLKDNLQFEYVDSLYTIKPILMNSEVDDSRPTVIKKLSDSPTFISVLSGKINTVFDLDEVLKNGKSRV